MARVQEARTRRALLDRDTVVGAGLALIDEDGLDELSMRRLGARLGVEAMALYRYVPSKPDLLDGIVSRLVAELDADAQVFVEPREGWEDFVRRLAHGVRRVALRHPSAFPLLASRHPAAPWLQPPLRSLEWVERFICGLLAHDFDDESVVAAYRAFSSFLLGHLLLEASAKGGEVTALDMKDEGTSVSLEDYPELCRLREELSDDEALAEFEQSLDNLLARMTSMRHGETYATT